MSVPYDNAPSPGRLRLRWLADSLSGWAETRGSTLATYAGVALMAFGVGALMVGDSRSLEPVAPSIVSGGVPNFSSQPYEVGLGGAAGVQEPASLN